MDTIEARANVSPVNAPEGATVAEMVDRYFIISGAYYAALTEAEDIECAARVDYPSVPRLILAPSLCRPLSEDEIEAGYRRNCLTMDEREAVDWRERRLEALRAYEQRCGLVRAARGYAEPKARSDELYAAREQLEQQIADTAADSAADIHGKLRILHSRRPAATRR